MAWSLHRWPVMSTNHLFNTYLNSKRFFSCCSLLATCLLLLPPLPSFTFPLVRSFSSSSWSSSAVFLCKIRHLCPRLHHHTYHRPNSKSTYYLAQVCWRSRQAQWQCTDPQQPRLALLTGNFLTEYVRICTNCTDMNKLSMDYVGYQHLHNTFWLSKLGLVQR